MYILNITENENLVFHLLTKSDIGQCPLKNEEDIILRPQEWFSTKEEKISWRVVRASEEIKLFKHLGKIKLKRFFKPDEKFKNGIKREGGESFRHAPIKGHGRSCSIDLEELQKKYKKLQEIKRRFLDNLITWESKGIFVKAGTKNEKQIQGIIKQIMKVYKLSKREKSGLSNLYKTRNKQNAEWNKLLTKEKKLLKKIGVEIKTEVNVEKKTKKVSKKASNENSKTIR